MMTQSLPLPFKVGDIILLPRYKRHPEWDDEWDRRPPTSSFARALMPPREIMWLEEFQVHELNHYADNSADAYGIFLVSGETHILQLEAPHGDRCV